MVSRSGLFASAVTIFVFSLFNLHDRAITIENAGVGIMVLFFSGICQIIAGLFGM
jgi:succinate-acetate transporter protein